MIFAYLDPTAGGMVIQTIVAAAVALPIILRTQIARGLARFRGRQNAEHAAETTPPSDD